jgi:hypothetical protein
MLSDFLFGGSKKEEFLIKGTDLKGTELHMPVPSSYNTLEKAKALAKTYVDDSFENVRVYQKDQLKNVWIKVADIESPKIEVTKVREIPSFSHRYTQRHQLVYAHG